MTKDAAPIIVVEDLVVRYGDRTVLDGISFEVYEGDIFGFLGPNGAGKTTTMRMIVGLIRPTAGRIEINGLDRPGLLYDVTREISDLNLDIASAHIATFGEKAVDVFYVTDLTGKKITSSSREGAIRERLMKALQARQDSPLVPA